MKNTLKTLTVLASVLFAQGCGPRLTSENRKPWAVHRQQGSLASVEEVHSEGKLEHTAFSLTRGTGNTGVYAPIAGIFPGKIPDFYFGQEVVYEVRTLSATCVEHFVGLADETKRPPTTPDKILGYDEGC